MTQFDKSRLTGKTLRSITPNKINRIINEIADEISDQADSIMSVWELDYANLSAEHPDYLYAKPNKQNLEDAAETLRNIASLPSPLGKIHSSAKRPNEIIISKIAVPYGVIGIVIGARPIYILDSVALCLKSGNSIIISSIPQTHNTNTEIATIIREILSDNGLDPDIVTLLDPTDTMRTSLLEATGTVDLIIPRGTSQLVTQIKEQSLIPTIDTNRGVCHIYIDKTADPIKASAIIHNSKTRMPIACNTVDCIIIHTDELNNLSQMCQPLAAQGVTIYADPASYATLKDNYPLLEESTEKNYDTEFMDYKIAIKTVKNIGKALNHIQQHSSKHSESIITEDPERTKQFINEVDCACVYHNLPTSFTDGGEFGMGGEIGISTQKVGVRGPISLCELTTYKYVITGNSQTR